MMVAPVVTEPSFQAGTPRALFTHTDPVGIPRTYSVSPDGARFVMLQPSEETMSPQIVVVTNWFEELKRVMPGR